MDFEDRLASDSFPFFVAKGLKEKVQKLFNKELVGPMIAATVVYLSDDLDKIYAILMINCRVLGTCIGANHRKTAITMAQELGLATPTPYTSLYMWRKPSDEGICGISNTLAENRPFCPPDALETMLAKIGELTISSLNKK